MLRKALVTGAPGFIGSNLVRGLINDNWHVSVVIREESSLEQLRDVIDQISIYSYDGTVGKMIQIMSIIEPNIVFHLASLFLVDHKPTDIDALIQSNILLGTHLLEAMANCGVTNLINTGTSWQHFENQEYNPVCLYAATKQAYEAIVSYYVQVKNLKVITLKLYDTYGTNDPRPKLLALLKKLIRTSDTIEMSGGDQRLNLVHINDVIKAYLISADRLLDNQVSNSETYAVSANELLSLKQLVVIIEEITGTRLSIEWGGRPYRDREVMEPWNNGNKLPNWEPIIDIRNGLRDYFSF